MKIRTVVPIVILKSIWETIEKYADEKKLVISSIFENKGKELLVNPRELVIEPGRRVTVYSKTEQFKREFPMIRSSLYVDAALLQNLFNVYEPLSIEKYGNGTKLDVNSLFHTVFYYFCLDNNLPVNKVFFDQHYFKKHFTFSDEYNFDVLDQIISLLGKHPTIREWRTYRKEFDGPSDTYIINRYGSFSAFKELAIEREGK